MTTNMSAAERYADRVRDMRADDLLDDLESSVRQNSYGSHDDQIRIVRAELLRRLSAEQRPPRDSRTFGIGDTVNVRGDEQWDGVVTGVGYGQVAVRWHHQTDMAPWISTFKLNNVTRNNA